VVTFTAAASDNVAVSSVQFLMDDSALQGTIQKSPSDGNYSLQIPINIVGLGNHSVSAVASDAAGNTTTSAAAAFAVGPPTSTGPDTTPPAVAAAVEGKFGLVKLTAIATDNGRVDGVDFQVDGVLTGYWASLVYLSSEPEDEYYQLFDTTGLTAGTHTLVARALDRGGNWASSAPVSFTVDPTAGYTEVEPNDSIAGANVVTSSQSQIAGTLVTVTNAIGESHILDPDWDYYRVSLVPGKTINVDMLSTQGFFLSVVDADGKTLSQPRTTVASDVTHVSFTNGSMPQDVFIQVTSIPYDFKTHNQYKLMLSYQGV